MLLLVLSAGAGSAAAQTVIKLCRPCIVLYQSCLASGQPESVCQAQELQCCLAQAGRSEAQAAIDRERAPKRR
ncbi:hypothetical protein [Fulvimonas soli]|jgi:hypothetical protein|nr:hypothetical protein [Fulvimonas soli]TNY26496.1 hypothetical protein BV497_08425 [Fulvimonas soli]